MLDSVSLNLAGHAGQEALVAAIDFLHIGVPYSGETLRSASMGGTESSVALLAEALARRGHDVSVFNGLASSKEEFGVRWRPLGEARDGTRGDIGIAVATPKAFNGLEFRKQIFWLHNPLKSWRQFRRGDIVPLLKKRPLFVLLGEYHADHVPRWLSSGGREIIQHGIHEAFFRQTPSAETPPPRAIFTSQPYRGVDWLLNLWDQVRARVPAATLDIFAPKAHQAAANSWRHAPRGVNFRGSLSRPALVREFATARVQLTPGHRDETFCLAAAEAIAAGIPVVTLGIGALSERVEHGNTGFIAHNKEEFIVHTSALLSDDELWGRMHRACVADLSLRTWDAQAKEWEKLFENFKDRRTQS